LIVVCIFEVLTLNAETILIEDFESMDLAERWEKLSKDPVRRKILGQPFHSKSRVFCRTRQVVLFRDDGEAEPRNRAIRFDDEGWNFPEFHFPVPERMANKVKRGIIIAVAPVRNPGPAVSKGRTNPVNPEEVARQTIACAEAGGEEA
jgi:hypothetical protein